MKKSCGWYALMFTVMILLITTSAGAFFTADEKSSYGGVRHLGILTKDPLIKSSTLLSEGGAVPEGLTKRAWGKIRASIEQDRYRVQRDERTGLYQAPNHAHGLCAVFTPEGFQVTPRKGENTWNWGLRLSRYGYGSDLQAVTAAQELITHDNRIAYLRGDIVEWYINDHRGLEQGFTLNARPKGKRGSGPLQLHLTLTGTLIPEVNKDRTGITFRDAQGKEVLCYSGLSAFDAGGKELHARMAVDQEEIRFIVEDHDAVYPITIDPFVETKKLLASDGAADDNFGYRVSISGDTAIVGARYDDDNGNASGSAYIFSRDEGGADNWGQVKKLLASDGAADDHFGYGVSISGDTAIVGADRDDDNGTDSGSAYVFSRDEGGADNWGQVKKLLPSDGAVFNYFGYGVSISEDTAIVGAYGDDDNGGYSGSAYIFSRDEGGVDNWGQVKKLLASDGEASDWFGSSVSISEDTAIVGAPYEDDNGSNSGSAYVFSRDEGGVDNWGQVKKLLASDGAAGDNFGWSVSISEDTAIVGAYCDDDNGNASGSAYVFARDEGGTDNWGQVKKLLASDGAADDYFGRSVSISEDTAIVGAYGDDDNGSNSGSAYVFSRNEGGADNWGEVKKITASDGAAGDNFGWSVSISEYTAIVGAYGDDDNGSESGSAYVFTAAPTTILHRDGALWSSATGWAMGSPPYYAGSDYARDLEFSSGGDYFILHKDGAVWLSWSGWELGTPPYYPGSNYAVDGEFTESEDGCILHRDGALWYSDTGWVLTSPPYYAGSDYARALELRADTSYVILHTYGAIYDSSSGWLMSTPPYYPGSNWVVDMKLETGGYVLLHQDGALWSTSGGWVLTSPPYYAGSDYARALELVGTDYVILHKDGALYDSVNGWNMDSPPYYPGSNYAVDLEVR